jgi:hypothetical protein
MPEVIADIDIETRSKGTTSSDTLAGTPWRQFVENIIIIIVQNIIYGRICRKEVMMLTDLI